MSLFKRFKEWLRGIIAEEVAKVSVSLSKERADSIATLKNVENDISRFASNEIARMKATLEAEHEAFVARLRGTRNHVADGEPNRWNATAETLAADNALKLVK